MHSGHSGHRNYRRWSLILLSGIMLGAGLGACGGDEDTEQASSTTISLESEESDTAGSVSERQSTVPGRGTTANEPAPIKVALGKVGWWEGTALTLDSLVATPGFGGFDVEVTGTFENLTDESQQLEQGTVIVDGAEVSAFWDVPSVPGKGKAEGTITFTVTSKKDALDAAALDQALANAAIVFGNSNDNQTKLPLNKAGKVESVQPKTLTNLGTLTHGQVIVEVLGGVLAPSYTSGAKGKAALDLRIKLSCSATCQASGNGVDRAMFSITGPSGQSVVASGESAYCCDAIYPGDVSDNPRNVLRFLVPLPGTGSYTLTLRSSAIVAQGGAPGTLTFTV